MSVIPSDRMKFRKCLFKLSEQLSRQDIENLTFICRDVVPMARMERVRSAIDLFTALEERGKLSYNNLDYLTQILNSIGRGDLYLKYFEGPQRQLEPSPTHQAHDYLYNECLLKIAQDLSSSEVDRLTFLVHESILQMNPDRIFSATQLFQLLQQRQAITATNLRSLYECLCEIGRVDVAAHINNYLHMIGRPLYHQPARVDEVSHGTRLPLYPRPQHDPHAGGGFMITANTPTSGIATNRGTPNPSTNPSTLSSSCSSMPSSHNSSLNTLVSEGMDSKERRQQYAMPQLSMEESEIGESKMVGVSSPSFSPPGVDNTHSGAQEYSHPTINPFGLGFNVFEDPRPAGTSEPTPSQNQANELLRALAMKEGQLRNKEQEIERMQEELTEQTVRGERLFQERVGDSDTYRKNIQELQQMLAIKNDEVNSLRGELQHFHHQMATLQAATPVREEDLYRMDCCPHGICLIFNNHKFFHPTNQEKAHPERGGAKIDLYNLEQTFKYLQYQVRVCENYTAQQMQDEMFQMTQIDHSKFDSFVCCILTHGEKDIVHGADSVEVNLMEFTALIKLCPSLRQKPKMFFIQACRGEAENLGVDIQKDSGPHTLGKPTIPQEADFFFGYATPQGNAAYRSRRHGSWYISELCKVFTQYAYTHNLSSMMKKVNNQVSKAFTKEGYKQCSEYVDRLRTEVHFFHFLRKEHLDRSYEVGQPPDVAMGTAPNDVVRGRYETGRYIMGVGDETRGVQTAGTGRQMWADPGRLSHHPQQAQQ